MLLDLLMRSRNQRYLENSREKSANDLSGDFVLLASAQHVYFLLIFSLLLIASPIPFTIPISFYFQCELNIFLTHSDSCWIPFQKAAIALVL